MTPNGNEGNDLRFLARIRASADVLLWNRRVQFVLFCNVVAVYHAPLHHGAGGLLTFVENGGEHVRACFGVDGPPAVAVGRFPGRHEAQDAGDVVGAVGEVDEW